MELHSIHKTFHHSHMGEEKQQMLNLNRRLETYLNRVKFLEEENVLLTQEIQALRRSSHGAATRRKGLEEELQQARMEVDAAWRDMVHTELEVGRLSEEFQALEMQRQKEAQAHTKAKTMLQQSRKEMEEEQRAQIWLREKASQLEHEMRFLIQTHEEDVAHLEATLANSKATMPTTLAQRGNHIPNLQQLGQEYSQSASRAWQEATEAYQGQLAQLEESLNQARSRLTQVDKEKGESHLRLQALQKEIASAQDIRQHLEKTVVQQRDHHSQEIQKLQAHLEGLEVEKAELSQQIDHLLLENRGLLQLKMSLGLEVATYRALLDSESLRGDISLLNQPRNISMADAVLCPQGVKKNNQSQLSAGHNTISFLSLRGTTRTAPTAIIATPSSRKPFNETPKILRESVDAGTTKSATWETPYPKILQDGAVENFRPQEVHEKVTYAEPLSPPNEQETSQATSEEKDVENWNRFDNEICEETAAVESVVSYQVESSLSSEVPFSDEVSHHQFSTPTFTPFHTRMTEEPYVIPDEADKHVPCEGPAEEEGNMQQPQASVEAQGSKECTGEIVEHEQEETSDSETEAVLEPTFESKTSSPMSECEHGEGMFNQLTDSSQEENNLNDNTVEIRQEISCFTGATRETDVVDKLYPDGEEMDSWDSVIERKGDLKTDEGEKKDEGLTQHAEPEEDLSARVSEHENKNISQDFATDVHQDDNVASSVMDKQVDDDAQHEVPYQESAPTPDKEEDDEEEDSQNVCVSWKTEVESDSYAQDNTLADTRPLIRYKSDETDANTQASHMDESESSEGDQDKKIGETGSGTWSESKSKRFGTMEDLCEEVEEEVLDEEYDLAYIHNEDKDASHSMTVSEHSTENAEEMIKKVSEGYLDEENEEFTKRMEPTRVDYDEELDIDRIVEQELENLSTDSYSVHFSQQQVSESDEVADEVTDEVTDLLEGRSDEIMREQEQAGQGKTDDMSFFAESGVDVDGKVTSCATIIDQPYENPYFSDSSVVMPQADTLADEVVHQEDQEAAGAPEKPEEEDDHNISMVTHADGTEDCSGFNDFISRPDTEEISHLEDPNSETQENLQDVAALVREVALVEVSESQEHPGTDVDDCHSLPDVQETAEWEVLENPSEDDESRNRNEHDQKCDDVTDSAESHPHDDKNPDEGIMIPKEDTVEISPDSVPEEKHIFAVKDSKEPLDTNDEDNNLHSVFSSGINNDFWVSSLETGATYEPDDSCNEAAEQTNQNLEFGEKFAWEDLDNPNVVNGNSKVDLATPKALADKKEQETIHSEMKQVLCRNDVEGDFIHSEESEVEGESWSSGEETV